MPWPESPSRGPPIYFPETAPGERAPERRSWYAAAGDGLTLACAALAAAPISICCFAASIARSRTASSPSPSWPSSPRWSPPGRALAGRAHRVHVRRRLGDALLLDWLAVDPSTPRGIQALVAVRRPVVHLGVGRLPGDRTPPASSARPSITDERSAALVRELAVMLPLVLGAVVSTCKSPGRTFVRAVPPRPSGGVGDTAGTSDRQGRRAGPRGWRGRRRGR